MNAVPASMGDCPGQAAEARRPCALREFLGYFLRLGTFGFGGPIALAAHMERDLVRTRGWMTPQDYREGLAFAQLAPGPLAAQLAMYLGWVRRGVVGATLVAFAFVLPSFLMVLALSAFYVRFGGLEWMRAAFYGINAAVIAIIIRSAFKLVRSTLGRARLLWPVFAVNALVTAVTQVEIVWLFALSGLVVLVMREVSARGVLTSVLAVPVDWMAGLHGLAPPGTLRQVALYFAEAGAFVFGSGLAIVPFLYGGVVQDFHWLTERQFIDAVAVAMITPGPVVITVAFIGYLVAGPLGAVAAAVGVFLPCYLFVVLLAPHYRRFAKNPRVGAFVSGVTAAATGAIAGAAFVLGRRAITDWTTAVIAVLALIVLVRAKCIPEPALILAAGLVGPLIGKGA